MLRVTRDAICRCHAKSLVAGCVTSLCCVTRSTRLSRRDTINRVLPYWDEAIVPELKAGKTVLISAHGNSLRALVKHLSGISDADISGLEIPTGQPIVYELDDNLTGDYYYLSEL